MKIVFLGTGTSVGVPAIGCKCSVCRSANPRNHRRRASLYVVAAGQHIIIDTPPDFREQVLTYRVPRVDAVLFTHSHADHVFGFDDIRRFCDVQDQTIPVYGAPETIRDLNRFFPYVHRRAQPGLSYPRVAFNECTAPFRIGAVRVTPLPVEHAGIVTYGYRLAAAGVRIGYIPDCHTMPKATQSALRDLDVVVLDALKRTPHPTHLSLDESIALLKELRPRRAYLTHMGHDLDYDQIRRQLPKGIFIPYDGLTLRL